MGWAVAEADGKEGKESPEQCFLSAVHIDALLVHLYKRTKKVQYCLRMQCMKVEEEKYYFYSSSTTKVECNIPLTA